MRSRRCSLDIASSAMTNFLRRPWLLTGTLSRIFRPASPLARRMPRKVRWWRGDAVLAALDLQVVTAEQRRWPRGQRRGPLRRPTAPSAAPRDCFPAVGYVDSPCVSQYPRESWRGIFSECVWWSISLLPLGTPNVWRYAWRVQFSVFRCHLTPRFLEGSAGRWRRLLFPRTI